MSEGGGRESAAGAVTGLVQEAQAGNRAAFQGLVLEFSDRIFNMVYFRVRSKPDAQDITQEVFMKAYENLSGLKDPSRFAAWLSAIALNRVRDFQRKERFTRLFQRQDAPELLERKASDAEGPEGLEHLLRKEFWSQVKALAKELSRREREIFYLRFLDQLALSQIALILKMKESTVKTHLYRAVAKFRRHSGLRGLLEEKA